MATEIEISFADGCSLTLRYRLSQIKIKLLAMKTLPKYKDKPKIPVFPWLIDIAFAEGEESFPGKEITNIEIKEKT